jgi:hypothetical protein
LNSGLNGFRFHDGLGSFCWTHPAFKRRTRRNRRDDDFKRPDFSAKPKPNARRRTSGAPFVARLRNGMRTDA